MLGWISDFSLEHSPESECTSAVYLPTLCEGFLVQAEDLSKSGVWEREDICRRISVFVLVWGVLEISLDQFGGGWGWSTDVVNYVLILLPIMDSRYCL